MIESLYFTYDGIKSSDMGIIQISNATGLFEESFLPSATIVEEKVAGNDKPYYVRTDRESLTLPISILFQNELTDDEARNIGRWLNQDFYKPLIFSDYPDKIYYAKYTGNPRLFHNGLKEGYVTLEMRCNAPYAFSPVYVDPVVDLSNNGVNGTEITFTNNGDYDCSPIIYLEKVGDGDFSIVNKSDGGTEMSITGLTNGESLTIDCETEEIETDLVGVYRYNNSNDVFLSLPRGVNYLQVYGKCKIQFKYEFKLI
jgi:predicted phage tail component-like protein